VLKYITTIVVRKGEFLMEEKIPEIVELLYHAVVGAPNPALWPDFTKNDPIQAHGLWCFYRGLYVGTKIADACRE